MVKFVTDSSAGIPADLAEKLGIAVVPLYVHFGKDTYRDGIDLTASEFYERLANGPVSPTTSAPSPAEFTRVYDKLAGETNEILAVLISSKLSATYEAALQGREGMKHKSCTVHVVDSRSVLMGLGLPLIATSSKAKGKDLKAVESSLNSALGRIHLLACFDTLEYLRRGGRIGRAKALLGSLLKVQPLITLKDGEVEPAGRERSRTKALHRLYAFAEQYKGKIESLAVEHAGFGDTPDEAQALLGQLQEFASDLPTYTSGISSVIGTHTGPGTVVVTVLEREPA